VERVIVKAKQFRRFATRYETLSEMDLAIVHRVVGFINVRKLARTVSTAEIHAALKAHPYRSVNDGVRRNRDRSDGSPSAPQPEANGNEQFDCRSVPAATPPRDHREG
jgi:hypothetical protein